MKKLKIKSVKKIGKRKTYNLTMKSYQHNYAIYSADNDDNFVFSANSHSAPKTMASDAVRPRAIRLALLRRPLSNRVKDRLAFRAELVLHLAHRVEARSPTSVVYTIPHW